MKYATVPAAAVQTSESNTCHGHRPGQSTGNKKHENSDEREQEATHRREKERAERRKAARIGIEPAPRKYPY